MLTITGVTPTVSIKEAGLTRQAKPTCHSSDELRQTAAARIHALRPRGVVDLGTAAQAEFRSPFCLLWA